MRRAPLLLSLMLVAGLAQAATTFGIRAAPGVASNAFDQNARGQLVAVTEKPDGHRQALLIEGGRQTPLRLADGGDSEVHAINAAGMAVGAAEDGQHCWHAFTFERSQGMRTLGTLGGPSSYAIAVNNKGQVTGYADLANGGYHAFLFDGVSLTDLGTLGGALSHASGINDAGMVVGTAAIDRDRLHAFLYTPQGGMQDLGTLGGANSMAAAINQQGHVAGAAQTARGIWHAFVHDGSKLLDLGALVGEGESFATSINSAGDVAGTAQVGEERRSFVWRGGKMTVYRGGQGLFQVNRITDQGVVLGAIRGTLLEAAFMSADAVPVEAPGLLRTLAPMTGAALALAGAIILWRRRYRGLFWRSQTPRR